MTIELPGCPFCGGEPTMVESETDGIPAFHYQCTVCGATAPRVRVFLDAGDRDIAIERACERWNLRARIARNEELADLVGEIRSLTDTISLGCRARTKAAQAARDAISGVYERLEKILPLARQIVIKPMRSATARRDVNEQRE